jgi:hypothetical protein
LGAKNEKAKPKLEGKLPPFSSFLKNCFIACFVAKRATTPSCHHLLFCVREKKDDGNTLLSSFLLVL